MAGVSPDMHIPFDGSPLPTNGTAKTATVGNCQFVKTSRGTVMKLDGKGSYVDTGITNFDMGDEWTVECWVNPAEKQNGLADIFGNHSGAGGVNGFVIQMDGSNQNRFTAHIGNTAGAWVSTKPVQLIANQWQHVAMVKTKADLRFYVNGILMSRAATKHAMTPSPTSLKIGLGIEHVSRCLTGYIDDFKTRGTAITDWKSLGQIPSTAALVKANIELTMVRNSSGKVDIAFNSPAGANYLKSLPASKVSLVLHNIVSGHKVTIPSANLTPANGYKTTVSAMLKMSAPSWLTASTKPTTNGVTLTQQIQLFPSGGQKVNPKPVSDDTIMMTSLSSRSVLLDGDDWKIATDPDNTGKTKKYTSTIPSSAKQTKVPWVIQDIFPGYHGVAWYWKQFKAPASISPDGRHILRFTAVDYYCEVYVNGKQVGTHEGAESPFECDITGAIKAGKPNLLTVKVLNPTHDLINGITFAEVPKSCKTWPVWSNAIYNFGGIVDSVVLASVPSVRITNLYGAPDRRSGKVSVQVSVYNTTGKPQDVQLSVSIGPSASQGDMITSNYRLTAPAGESVQHAELTVRSPHLWDVNDPFLYRLSVSVTPDGGSATDHANVRIGFRDFEVKDGFTWLNGKRIALHGLVQLIQYPVGYGVPTDWNALRKDANLMKAMGFNAVRLIFGGAAPRYLDVLDEAGILVYQEHYATSLGFADSPQFARRYDQTLARVIVRDRNHPSIIAWGMANEQHDGPHFRRAYDSIPLVRSLDEQRLLILNSGRFDLQWNIGSISIASASKWQTLMGKEAARTKPTSDTYGSMPWSALGTALEYSGDKHYYPNVPYTNAEIENLRTIGKDGKPYLLTEFGAGGAVDLWRLARKAELINASPQNEDVAYNQGKLDQFMADWEKQKLWRVWPRVEEFFQDSHRNMSKIRAMGLNALSLNQNLMGSFMCAASDSDFNGVGLVDGYRDLKPGVMDLMRQANAPLRWAIHTDKVNIRPGEEIIVRVHLVNEDILSAGKYPAELNVLSPDGQRVIHRQFDVVVPDQKQSKTTSFTMPVFVEPISIDGVEGKYQLSVSLLKGAPCSGGIQDLYMWRPDQAPKLSMQVAVWPGDNSLKAQFARCGIDARDYISSSESKRNLIVIGHQGPKTSEEWQDIYLSVARGSTLVILDQAVLAKASDSTGWLPYKNKGLIRDLGWGYYRTDVFAGHTSLLPDTIKPGMADYHLLREILPQYGYSGLDAPSQLAFGHIRTQQNDYLFGELLSQHSLGQGSVILSTLNILDQLDKDPLAERFLKQILASSQPAHTAGTAELPDGFDEYLKECGI